VLCLDKTGTITTNVLTVEQLHPLAADEEALRSTLGAFCSSVSITNRSTEAVATAFGEPARPVREEVQFDSARKWSALAFDDAPGVYVLGAPEVLTPHLDGDAAPADLVGSWSERGLRVLLFAHAPDATTVWSPAGEPQLPASLVPLGYVILRDELRPGARDVIARFFDAGINVKIISGDHPLTVAALAREAGIPHAERAVAGADLPMDDDEALARVVEDTVVFGRVVPDQKERIIEALQRRGHYVAMIGDGVNDVPAMKRAHVSIAVRAGSPVTRGIADMILLDDSFASLPSAFSEGRRIRAGMEMIIRIFLVRTVSVALMILGTALLTSEFPFTPRPHRRAFRRHRRHPGGLPRRLGQTRPHRQVPHPRVRRVRAARRGHGRPHGHHRVRAVALARRHRGGRADAAHGRRGLRRRPPDPVRR
jgi:cation-transporting P-type ATPase E